MKKYIVAKIHNMSLGTVTVVDTVDDAKNLVKDMFFQQFGRPINDSETDQLEDMLEIYNDEDHDNHYTFSIADLA
jgi:hypothetical protein